MLITHDEIERIASTLTDTNVESITPRGGKSPIVIERTSPDNTALATFVIEYDPTEVLFDGDENDLRELMFAIMYDFVHDYDAVSASFVQSIDINRVRLTLTITDILN